MVSRMSSCPPIPKQPNGHNKDGQGYGEKPVEPDLVHEIRCEQLH
jgi:hypothetical protein